MQRNRTTGRAPQDKHGFLRLGRLLSERDCAAMLDYLSTQRMTDSRGSRGTFDIRTVPREVKFDDFAFDTVVNCPNVMRLANHPDLLRLALNYLGFKPAITNVSLRRLFATNAVADDVQQCHRDWEPSSLKILIFLTNVDMNTGPRVYMARSHKERRSIRLRVYSDEEVTTKRGEGVTVTGRAGTAFAIDPRGIHKGVAPQTCARLLLCIQYSLVPLLIYRVNSVSYAGDAVLDPYVNRILVAQA